MVHKNLYKFKAQGQPLRLNAKQRYLQPVIHSIVFDISYVPGLYVHENWSVGSAKTVNLYAGYKDIAYDKDGYVQSALYEKYTFDNYARTSAHEFGLPFKTVFEALGADLNEQDKNNKFLVMAGEKYIYKLYTPDLSDPDDILFMIKNEKYKELDGDYYYIQLHPMSSGGSALIVNDEIYIYQDSAIRLLNYFGYNARIEIEKNTLFINKVGFSK